MNLPFIDCETTGLPDEDGVPRHAMLLEVGIVIVELPTFEILEEAEVQFRFDRSKYTGHIHPKVVDMHIENGLWDACERAEYDDYQKMDADLSAFLVASGCQGATPAGANPSFDRSFLRAFLPGLNRLLHYRNFETNSFWLLREFIEGAKGTRDKGAAHRAVADCKEAIGTVEKFWDWMSTMVRPTP